MARGRLTHGMFAILTSTCALLLAPAGSGATRSFDIPGLFASAIRIAGVERLNDGGAVIAATLGRRGPHSPSRVALVRLLADGTPDLAYGSLGIFRPRLGDVQATALAVNPASGEAWVGLSRGHSGGGELLAVDGGGSVVTTFGRNGRTVLRAAVPQVIAWRPGQLLVAMGGSSCRGCIVGLASAGTGSMSRTRRLHRSEPTAPRGRCTAQGISAARFTHGGNAVLVVGAAGPGCRGGVARATPSELVTAGVAVSATAPFGRTAGAGMLGVLGTQTCVGAGGPAGTEFGSLNSDNAPRPVFRGPAGTLLSVVALGRGACAVLVRTSGGGIVLQAMNRRRTSRDAVPRAIEPLGMFRCHQHLLVIGATRHGSAVVLVVPVRRGPYGSAATMRAARIASTGSGCR